MASSGSIRKVRVEERHQVVDFGESAEEVPAEAEVQSQAGINFEVVLDIGGIGFVSPASFANGVLVDAAAIRSAEKITGVGVTGGRKQRSTGIEAGGFVVG